MNAEIAEAVRALEAGDVVVYPTETVYGLGVRADSTQAIDRLFRLKGRPEGKGVSLLVEDLTDAVSLIEGPVPAPAIALAEAFWPGPLTIVLPAAAGVDRRLVGEGGGVGLRCSSDSLARALIAACPAPITSTSANPTGKPPATDVDTARRYFGFEAGAYVDGGVREGGAVSTVVEFSRGRAILRRAGAIDSNALDSITPVDTSP
jgi:L-threonylcarbamoyladenylate synthase